MLERPRRENGVKNLNNGRSTQQKNMMNGKSRSKVRKLLLILEIRIKRRVELPTKGTLLPQVSLWLRVTTQLTLTFHQMGH